MFFSFSFSISPARRSAKVIEHLNDNLGCQALPKNEMEVRDNRLYRAEYNTFEQYCRERWQFQKRHAYRLIDSAKVLENVSNWTQKPATESQARPLAKLPAKEQKEVWQEAVETAPGGKVTAKQWVGD